MDFSNLKESQKVEFKTAFNKEAIITISAFANTDGGQVIIGMDDNGHIKGIACGPETLPQYLNEIKLATYPQLSPKTFLHEIKGKTLLVLQINEYPIKPVAYKGRYYKRVGNSNHILSLDEIVDLQQQSLNLSFDAYTIKEDLASLDQEIMDRYFEKANTTERANLRDDPLGNLTKLKIIQDGKPTLAAMLLFGNHGYSIHIGRFKSPDTIIDDLMLKEPLPVAIEEAMIFIKKHINLSFGFDGSLKRKETWQYPLEALRELLLNAVVHRDYRNTSDIVIKIFDDRIVFTNPGKLYGNLTIEDLKRDDYVSAHRNRLLAEAFYLTGDIEKYGTGLIRVREMLAEYPDVELTISEMGDFFKVEVASRSQRPITDLKNDRIKPLDDLKNQYALSDNQIEILRQIRLNSRITQQELSEHIGITPRNIRNNMNILKEKGLLRRVGSLKKGHWEIIVAQGKDELL